MVLHPNAKKILDEKERKLVKQLKQKEEDENNYKEFRIAVLNNVCPKCGDDGTMKKKRLISIFRFKQTYKCNSCKYEFIDKGNIDEEYY
jgi:transposase-like protein